MGIDLFQKVTTYHPISLYLRVFNSGLIFGWLIWESIRTLHNFPKQDVEPWILARFRLVISGSILSIFCMVPDLFSNGLDPLDYSNPIIIFDHISKICIIFALSLCFFLAWVMPKRFKSYLNRNSHVEDLSQLDHLSESDLILRLRGDLP